MAAPTSPPLDDVPDSDESTGRRRFFLTITTVVVGALLVGWVYILFFYNPALMIDELPDRQFPTSAEQVCADARAQLAELPVAQNAADADARADEVERSNVILAGMVAQLGPLVATVPGADRAAVREWVDDWGVYLDNREQYVDNLRTDDEARFLESSKGKPTKGVSRAINGFAEVNEMKSCVTPGDLS